MKEKSRTALRIAVYYKHTDICAGAYSCGPIFRNPSCEVAMIFQDMLFFEVEFNGHFSNVVFAFEPQAPGSLSSSSCGPSSSSHKSDMQTFKEVFDPATVHKIYQ